MRCIVLPLLLAGTACTSILGDDFRIVPESEPDETEGASASTQGSGGAGASMGEAGAPSGGGGSGAAPLKPNAIAVGGFHSCVLRNTNTVSCWGRNDDGQLGAGTTSIASGPITVASPSVFAALAAGTNFTCGMDSSGAVRCWGANAHGQLGIGTFTPLDAPTDEVQDLNGVKAINAVAYSACALKDNGSVWCWGDDVDNTLGDDNNPLSCESENYIDPITCPVATPQQASVSGAIQLARGLPRSVATGGANRSCVVRDDDAIWCWGPGSPSATESISSVASIAAGAGFTCAAKADGIVVCFGGSNGYGQLGNGTTTPPAEGIAEVALPPAVMLAAGKYTTCAVLEDRTVMCWGDNGDGQLGAGTSLPYSATPMAVTGLDEVVSIAVSPRHACALRADDTVWCWGSNQYAQLGSGAAASSTPVQVEGL